MCYIKDIIPNFKCKVIYIFCTMQYKILDLTIFNTIINEFEYKDTTLEK